MNKKVVLPLYSPYRGLKKVYEKSGLNQWNASGRERDPNEVYIPIPAWIHDFYPDFFPDRLYPFKLQLPNDDQISVKVCQAGGKALMSRPNKVLGKWILRKILNLKDFTLVEYKMLEKIGIDSVEIEKKSNGLFCISIVALGSYDKFRQTYNPEG